MPMTADGALVLWNGDPAAFAAWRANAADGSTARLTLDGSALRLDVSFGGHGSWVIARRELAAAMPPHYVAVLAVRSAVEGQPELQLKLIDPSGTNVWWWRRPCGVGSERIALRKASLQFAWGPLSGGDPTRIGAIELALASDRPGSGTLWIEALRIEPRDPAETQPRVHGVRASSAARGHHAEAARSTEAVTWQPARGDAAPWLELDLGRTCEFGGAVIDFAAAAVDCRLLGSNDGAQWTALAEAAGGDGRRRWLRTSDGEARLARIEFAAGSVPEVSYADVVPLELALSPAGYLTAGARRAPRGRFPRHLLGEQAYWALVGADGDQRKGLLSEDGALEIDAESFTLEPFLWVDGRLLSWADVATRVSLADGHLPIPTVEWEAAGLRLRITACAAGAAGQSALVARYALESLGDAPRTVRLFVAVRPFQVNPAWQSLNLVGGVAPITAIECTPSALRVNGAQRVIAVTRTDARGAAQTEEGLAALASGQTPAATRIDDPLGFAEGALAFDLSVRPDAAAVVAVAVPLFDATPTPPQDLDASAAATWADERLAETLAHWRTRLARVPIELPSGAARFADTLRASLAWILVNRDGPRIQPGPRCYRRSWIRDGTLTGTAIAEMGFADEARAFMRWYAPYQLADGRVPCAVDHRGIDQAVEHDSHGQLVWGTVELFRLTGDLAFLRELWPHALRAVDAIAALRAQRTTDAYRDTAKFGLLPESISHEGYASHPVHSYWDDFFAVRALADAADAAAVLGDDGAAQRVGTLRDAMRADLKASVARSMTEHGIDFIPGSAELGDFDPTSTAIALDPCGAAALLPPDGLVRTFDRYWAELEARRRGDAPNDAYTPYEVRTAAALVMLGREARAASLLEALIADQRLEPWCEWPEIAWRDRRAPRFFGDLPHGWVASSFVRAVRRMIAYERRDDAALVLAAGVPEAWVREAPGVRVRGLPTYFGPLDYTMHAASAERIDVTLGSALRWPPGGVIIVSPFARPLRRFLIDGREQPAQAPDRVALSTRARHVVLDY